MHHSEHTKILERGFQPHEKVNFGKCSSPITPNCLTQSPAMTFDQ